MKKKSIFAPLLETVPPICQDIMQSLAKQKTNNKIK